MLFKKRVDGSPAKVPGYTKMMPHLMPTRTESTIYADQIVELDKTIAFIEDWNSRLTEGERPLTVLQILLCALTRTVAQRPRLNRFISNRIYYQRNHISATFVAKKTLTDDGLETNVIMPLRPEDTLQDVNQRFSAFVGEVKSDDGGKMEADVEIFDKLPQFVLRAFFGLCRWLDRTNLMPLSLMRMFPFYCTAFITNVGSLGLQAPFHHNFEFGTTGLFVALGEIKKEKVIQDDNVIVDKHLVKLTYTMDDRIVDGIYSGRGMELIKTYIENPEKLMDKPDLSPKLVEELGFTDKGWKIWAKN